MKAVVSIRESDPVKTEIRAVNPSEAQAWLDHKAPNRSIESKLVLAMARDMIAGRWQVTHQGIAFDERGALLDGQHRLAAIVLADRPVETMLTWNLPRETQLVMDDQRKRSGADVLTIESGATVSTLDVAILQFLGSSGKEVARRFTKSEMRDALATYGHAIRFVTSKITAHVRGVTMAPIIAPAVRAFLKGEDQQRIAEFIKVLSSGIPQSATADIAALRLRDWCLQNRDARRRPYRAEMYARSSNALRLFLDRKDVSNLRAATRELFELGE